MIGFDDTLSRMLRSAKRCAAGPGFPPVENGPGPALRPFMPQGIRGSVMWGKKP